MSINIGFYLGNNKGQTVNAKDLLKGNPGIGGTQYVMLLVAYYLSQDSEYNVFIYSRRKYILPENMGNQSYNIDNIQDLFSQCKQQNIDILLIRDYSKEIAIEIQNTNLKIIYWSHNYIDAGLCSFISKTPQIKCNVFVGKQQYDAYIDDDVITKSVYIYNLFNDTCSSMRFNDSKTVVFLGSLTEKKGFLEMCRIWKGIVKQVPQAQLLVMGTGALYGETELGPLGIASESFERKFIPLISDSNGKILDSVKFLGVVGSEKENYFLKSSVGVINPSTLRETFGMGIVEMAATRLPVVTYKKNGYYDTTMQGETAILGSSLLKIQEGIVTLLKNKSLNDRLGNNAKQFIIRFSPESIIPKWKYLLMDVYNDKFIAPKQKWTTPIFSDFKIIRILIRYLRFNLHIKFIPSLQQFECFIRKVVRK